MNSTTLASLLQGLAWVFFAVGGLAFLVGGRALHEFANTERMLAEIEGIGIAVVCGVLGVLTKAAGNRLAAQKIETSMFNGESNDDS